MAENLDQNALNQINESLNDMARILPTVMQGLSQVGGIAAGTTNVKDGLDKYNKSLKEGTERQKADAFAKDEMRRKQNNLSEAMSKGTQAMDSFASALFNGTGEFAKYNSALSSAGDAALAWGKNFGPLGLATGALVKGVTKAAEMALKQADDTLKATDSISKMGAMNSFTAEGVRKMGTDAGLASDQLDKMIKPMSSMSGGLTRLGATSADGVEAFGKMIAVTKETRMEFQRLGLNDQERIQAQSDFIGMMERSGGVLSGQLKTSAGLQKASLDYTKNLYELSSITGKSIEESKKDMEVARATYEWKLQENKWARQLRAAQESGNETEMARIEAEKEGANRLINDIAKLGDPTKTAAVQLQYLTGAITPASSQFAVLGVDIEKQIKAAKENTYQSGEFNNAYKKAADTMLGAGDTALALSEDFRKATGLDEKALDYNNKREGVADEVVAAAAARKKLEDNSVNQGIAAQDAAQIARNELTELERKAKIGLDDLVASVNPLMQGFDKTTIAATTLVAAAGAAAIALGAMAAKTTAGKAIEAASGTGSAGAGKGGGIRSMAGGLLKGGVAALGGMALSKGGEYAKEQGHAKTGAGLDIAGTTASYAGTGAMMGSIVPGLGTAVGAGMGAVVGAGVGLYNNRETLFGMKSPAPPVASSVAMGNEGRRGTPPTPQPPEGSDNASASTKVDIAKILKFGTGSGSKENFEGLDSTFKDAVIAAAAEYNAVTGNMLMINSAKRASEDQQRLYDESVAAGRPGIGPTGMAIGKPGRSLHERGLAVDVQNYKDPAAIAALNKQGLIQKVPGDPVHFQASGGAMVNGPSSGYPVEATFHGNEIVAPLDPDSILTKLSKTSVSELSKEFNSSTSNSTTENIITSNAEMIDLMKMFVEKMDDFIDAQSDSNSIQNELLQYSKV